METIFDTYQRYPFHFEKGEGSWLYDDKGEKYLDFTSGLAVTNLGHRHPVIVEKVKNQLDQLWHTSNLFSTSPQQELAQKLTEQSSMDRVFFCNSGAEANEAAIKIARKYGQHTTRSHRYEIITFEQSFHGRTIATLAATGQDKVKTGFRPLPQGFRYCPYNDIVALDEAINEHTCAIMLEMIQGEGGVNVAESSFIQHIKKRCEEHQILLIIDEIQTGIGRTGTLFAYEHWNLQPDIITTAKGLANGLPIGAMLATEKLAESFSPGSHGSTFGGNPIACTAANAVLDVIEQQQLITQAAIQGDKLLAKLTSALQHHDFVKTIRGKGLLIGIECKGKVHDVIQSMHDQKLLVIPAGPNVIRLLPNLLVTDKQIDTAVQTIQEALNIQNV
ncbi:acetylornithine transaminase [Longirhabdus pacifica]|uniref:acetylornithine transaminase n=1 Tax=Longirhabdus pacifica TaxID=2305227 RepID=UPI001008BD81|nr:acetylornithine transaminase [Longirhabdus pacifica]